MAAFGYAGKILRVDLSSRSISEVLTSDYADRFIGGRGIAAKFYWDEVPPDVGAFDEENRLIFVTGPVCGLSVRGGARWEVCSKAPVKQREEFSYNNLGGRWGAELKFAGYDAIVVQGKSEKPVYIFIHDGVVEFKDASALWGKGAIDTRQALKDELGESARVVTIGPAGENLAVMATLTADNDASGSGGLGASMGSKKLKAIVVSSAVRKLKAAHPERLRELMSYINKFTRVPIAVSSIRLSRELVPNLRDKMKNAPCYGCTGCMRNNYEAANGQKGKYMCGSALFYQGWAVKYYGKWNDVSFFATKLLDNYGLDSWAIDPMIGWLKSCYDAGILSDQNTGIPISRVGSLEFMETLVKKISFRDGFGDVLARGLYEAAEAVGPEAKKQLNNAYCFGEPGSLDHYGPRLILTNGLFLAMEPRKPVAQLHEIGTLIPKWALWVSKNEKAVISTEVIRAIAKRFWGSELAVDFSTLEGKALSAVKVQDRETAKECLILCDIVYPFVELGNTEDHVGDPSVESKILSAVTGTEVDEDGLNKIGARVFNLQRAILVREGHRGRDFDVLPDFCYTAPLLADHVNPECIMPGKGDQIISRKGAVVDRGEFEKLKDDYYQIRRWDVATGLQTRESLEELGLGEVAADLESRGLAIA